MAYQSEDKSDDAILDEARERWKYASESDSDQRKQESDDLSFQVPENQWTEKAKKERQGRPMLSISKLDQPIQLVLNQERAAKLGVNIHPLSEEANDDTAQIIQGLYRHIERDSHASKARSWAFQRAVIAGRGYWRVACEYDEDGGHSFDQKITIEPIYYQHAVVWDPASTKPDKSDAKFCFLESWVDEDTYRYEWPNAPLPANDVELERMETQAPGWTEMQGNKRAYRVVEYWYKTCEKESIVMLEDGSVVPEKDVPEGAKVMKRKNGEPVKRDRNVERVVQCKVSGVAVLEKVNWDGKYIPIVSIVGRELQPFDGKRRCVGIVNHSKDGQRFFNYAATTYVERMAKEPKAPIVGYVGQFEGLEEMWDQLNTRDVARLEVNPVTDKSGQNVLPLPQRMQIDLTGTSLAGQAMQIADGLIQSTTTVFDAGLGRLTDDNRKSSGRALLALQQQADASTSDFMQQLADAMNYEARVVLDLMPTKYDRPGRVTRILRGDDDKAESVMLNKPHAIVNGRPVVTDGAAANVKHYDLKRGRYGVSVSIGKSFQTRLEHGAEFMATILEKMPQYLPILGDLLFRYRDDPGAKEVADRLVKMRERTMPGLGEGEDGQIPPEQLQAQLQAQAEQMKAMQQQMQMMSQALETDKAKQEAAILRAQMDNAAKVQVSQEDNRTKIIVAQIQAQQKAAFEELKAMLADRSTRQSLALEHVNETRGRHEEMAHETGKQAVEHRHEREMMREKEMLEIAKSGMDRMHEDTVRHEGMAHDVGMAAGKGQTVEFSREGGQESDREHHSERSQGATRAPESEGDDE